MRSRTWLWVGVACFCAAWVRPQPLAAQAKSSNTSATKTGATLREGALIALLPTAANPGEAPAHLHAASQAIAQRLRKGGYRLLSPREVDNSLSQHALEGCKTAATCDPMLALVTLGADAVVSTALWRRSGGAPQLVVYVRHRNGYGQGEVNASRNEVPAIREAALLALTAALEDSRQVHEVKVVVESSPNRATVHVDQTLSGTTPAHFELLPGSHLVSVEAPGYVTRAQYLELSDKTQGETRLHVQLDRPAREHVELPAPAPAAAAEAEAEPMELKLPSEAVQASTDDRVRDTADARSPLNYVLGATLLGISLPFLANAGYSAATHGDCVGSLDATGRCAERVVFGPLFFVSLGIGILAAASGSTFLLLAPIRAEPDAPSPTDARAGTGLRVQFF